MEYVIDNTTLPNISAAGITVNIDAVSVDDSNDAVLTYSVTYTESLPNQGFEAGRVFIIFDDGTIHQSPVNRNIDSDTVTFAFEVDAAFSPQVLFYSSPADNDQENEPEEDAEAEELTAYVFSSIDTSLQWQFDNDQAQLNITAGTGHFYSAYTSYIIDAFIDPADSLYDNSAAGFYLVNTFQGQQHYAGDGDDIMFGSLDGDVLYGGAGNDILNGSEGGDFMHGGEGNDTYFIDSIHDLAIEYANPDEGDDDIAYSFISYYTLEQNIEHLTLLGTAVGGYGNVLDNIITGNEQNNFLGGFAGNDVIDGAGGQDTVIYPGMSSDYVITSNGSAITVTANDGSSTDLLSNIELLQFDDETIGSGTVSDGYIAGAEIFVDSNNNGLAEAAESTGIFTDPQGKYPALVNATGNLMAVGGINTDTGLANTLSLAAPANAAVINPLTTLVAGYAAVQGVSAAEAEAAVENAIGINSSVNLLFYDPLSHADETGLQLQKLAVQLAVAGTVGADIGQDFSDIIDSVAAYIAESGSLGQFSDMLKPVLSESSLLRVSAITSQIEQANSLADIASAQLTGLGTATVTGGAADDLFHNNDSADYFDGGDGVDRVEYADSFGDYALSSYGDHFVVSRGIGEFDSLVNIERLSFSDRQIAIDVEGNLGTALRFIGTIASVYLDDPAVIGAVLELVDQGNHLEDLFETAFDMGLIKTLAIGDTDRSVNNEDIARLALRNVLNIENAPATVTDLSRYMESPDGLTQVEFLTTAAGLDINANIDWQELQLTGIEYLLFET